MAYSHWMLSISPGLRAKDSEKSLNETEREAERTKRPMQDPHVPLSSKRGKEDKIIVINVSVIEHAHPLHPHHKHCWLNYCSTDRFREPASLEGWKEQEEFREGRKKQSTFIYWDGNCFTNQATPFLCFLRKWISNQSKKVKSTLKPQGFEYLEL